MTILIHTTTPVKLKDEKRELEYVKKLSLSLHDFVLPFCNVKRVWFYYHMLEHISPQKHTWYFNLFLLYKWQGINYISERFFCKISETNFFFFFLLQLEDPKGKVGNGSWRNEACSPGREAIWSFLAWHSIFAWPLRHFGHFWPFSLSSFTFLNY